MLTQHKVLSEEKHSRLICEQVNVCSTANIPTSFLAKSMHEYCNKVEIDWVKNFKVNRFDSNGLLLTGLHSIAPDTKMMVITAAFLRNFIDARILPLNTILTASEAGTLPSPTVLLIPNLFVRSVGKSLPAWRIQALYDVLLSRRVAGMPTVVYVEDMASLESEYGQVFYRHLLDHYTISKG